MRLANDIAMDRSAGLDTADLESPGLHSDHAPAMGLADYLAIARKNHASDVLIMVGDAPAIRASGHWERVGNVPQSKEDLVRLSRELLDDASMQVLERKRALDFSRSFEGLGRIRCNLHYQRDHLAMVLRLLWPEIPPPEQLGIPQHVIDAGNLHDGLILVSGSTGSGKSTTLAAIVEHINRTR
jgi:twitching motility protein PilT